MNCDCLIWFVGHFVAYLHVIINGGRESQLPEKYLSFLKSIVHNGQDADQKILTQVFPEMVNADDDGNAAENTI